MNAIAVAALLLALCVSSSLSLLFLSGLRGAAPAPPPADARTTPSRTGGQSRAKTAAPASQTRATPGNVAWPKDLGPNAVVKDDALHVTCPAGSYSSKGGINKTTPIAPADDVTLSYEVFLEPGWCWGGSSKAGKLLGLWFGDSAKKSGGTGGQWDGNSGSMRCMWYGDGEPNIYIYYVKSSNTDASRRDMSDQDPEYAKIARASGTAGHYAFGGKFSKFKVGAWNSIVLRMKLNTPGKRDGIMSLTVNGETNSYDKMMWRNKADQKIQGVLVQVFHGGASSSFACNAATHAQVRNMKVS